MPWEGRVDLSPWTGYETWMSDAISRNQEIELTPERAEIDGSIILREASARHRAGSVLQHRIEDLRRLAENPVLVACLGEGEGLLRRG